MDKTFNYHESILSFHHIVNRECTKDWNINGPIKYHNFMLVYDGTAFLQKKDNPGQLIRKGDLVYLPPNVNRTGYTFKDNLMKCYAINFSMESLKGNTTLPFDFIQHIENTYIMDSMMKLFLDLVNTWNSTLPYKGFELNSLFSLILKNIFNLKDSINHMNYEKIRKVNTIIAYMKDNINKNISIKEFALLLKISPTYTNKIFKELTNTSIIKYFNKLKIEKAKEYLSDGYSVGDCSIKLGISDIYYFSKLFKLYEKTSPSEYKRTII